jgi:hypothetical protein
LYENRNDHIAAVGRGRLTRGGLVFCVVFAGAPSAGSSASGISWLVAYVVCNLVTTVLNKAIFSSMNWPHPMSLALWH